MIEIERVPSSEFRVTFARLRGPVAVTVLNRTIGHYLPGGVLEVVHVGEGPDYEELIVLRLVPRPARAAGLVGPTPPAPTGASDGDWTAPDVSLSSGSVAPETVAAPEGPRADGPTAPMTQADKDRILRRVAKGAG
jgi:hypothetical protein